MKTLDELLERLRVRFDDGTDPHLWGVYMDMIKSAAAREREAVTDRNHPGNAAALREALAEARKVIKAMGGYWARVTLPIIDAALAAPARQCDVGTPAEQERRYKATGEVYHTLTLTNALAWAQTPCEAQEGGAE